MSDQFPNTFPNILKTDYAIQKHPPSCLEQLMIICTEKDTLNELENNTIIDTFASQNKLLKTLLIT